MSGHVAIVLPGANYGPELPALAIPIEVLQQAKAKVVTVEYPGGMWPDWRRAESGDWSVVHDSLAPQVASALRGASRVTVVAKSMGTSIFPFLPPLIDVPTTAIWVTPLFHMADVRALLLDEPFGALDAQTKKNLQDFLLTVWNRTRTTILMVTHDVEEAIYLSSRIYVLEPRPGRVAEVVDIPFGRTRTAHLKRDPRFLDLREELSLMLG